jgi:antitoxin component of RelBE/YafQ-DinJ toxin-antitoxin module
VTKRDDKVIAFRTPKDVYEAAHDKAKRKDVTLSQVLRRLLRRWVREPNGPGESGDA